MEDTHDPRLQLHEPPDELITYPYDRVKALLDNPDQVNAAIEELVDAGFDREKIFVLCGPLGADRLDVDGRHHGLRGRIYRFVEQLGDVRENLQQSADHLKAGGFWLTVPADEENMSRVAEILSKHGAHDMVHYGQWHHEQLGS
ncbi:MAG: hypothetical protein ABR592_08505 [Nitriliruptorales bacterium]